MKRTKKQSDTAPCSINIVPELKAINAIFKASLPPVAQGVNDYSERLLIVGEYLLTNNHGSVTDESFSYATKAFDIPIAVVHDFWQQYSKFLVEQGRLKVQESCYGNTGSKIWVIV